MADRSKYSNAFPKVQPRRPEYAEFCNGDELLGWALETFHELRHALILDQSFTLDELHWCLRHYGQMAGRKFAPLELVALVGTVPRLVRLGVLIEGYEYQYSEVDWSEQPTSTAIATEYDFSPRFRLWERGQ